MFHTVLGESVNPSPTSPPWMRLVAPARILCCEVLPWLVSLGNDN
jgi:hypothetical protein